MCGITGIISKGSTITEKEKEIVHQMNKALIHRGPDNAGYFNDEMCALAMRRLSIIDIDNGTQPITNENGDVVVFMNGEIYNYRELRIELLKKGHVFSTLSDTEVLAHLFEEYREKMVSHLKGMFAFCIYEKSSNYYLIARDRFGEKPLYYFMGQNRFAFSSEISSLLKYNDVPRTLNHTALPYYFRTSLVPEPMTLFKEIMSLPAGHLLMVQNEAVLVEKYFTIDYNVDENIKSDEDAIDIIKPKLQDAVKRQSVSDVQICSFLSGGIDSSSMVALLQKQFSTPLQTFTVKFEDDKYDESKIAKKVSEFCGTLHEEIRIPNLQFSEELFWRIIDHVGLPFRDSSAIPTFAVSEAISKYTKVAISGDGGDELFGGYDLFQWYLKISNLKKAPTVFRWLASASLKTLPDAAPSFLRKLDRALDTSRFDHLEMAIALNEMNSHDDVKSLLKLEVNQEQCPLLKQYPSNFNDWSPLRKIMYYRIHHTLPSNMLMKVDRMSMASSLEVRAPFLDIDLFEASAKLPDKFLIRGGVGKFILKKAMEDELPAEVFTHPKQGFNMPLHRFQNDIYTQLAERLLMEENPLPDLFAKEDLKKILYEGLATKEDSKETSVFRTSHKLWMMMQFMGWAQRFKVTY